MNANRISVFCRQLHKLLKQGIGLRTALLFIGEMDEDMWGKRMSRLVAHLDRGVSLGEAMQNEGFPALFTSFVMAGEQHGGLGQALEKCELYYRAKHDVQQKLLKAFAYPAMVIVLMAVAFLILQTTVLPQFALLYETMGIDLPWYTRLLLAANEAGFKAFIIFVLLVLPVASFVLRKRREQLLQFGLRVPVVRETWQLRFTSVFSWQLGLLLQAGIPLIDAFEMIRKTWPWESGKQAISRVQERLKKGFSLREAFSPEAGGSFHRLLPQQLSIGEASGMVAEMLLYSGELADEKLEERMQWVLRVWEPLLILLIGLALAAMVLALFLPMLTIVDGL